MMGCFSYMISMVFLSSLVVISSASDSLFRDDSSTGRNLLQIATSCPISFENQNYSVITSECKGPKYLPTTCCPALKKFACPFSDQINDLSNNCASTMFSYITLSGNYPAGLFADECRDGKEGLDCTGYLLQSKSSTNTCLRTCIPSAFLISGGAFLGLLFWFM